MKTENPKLSIMDRLIKFCLLNKLLIFLLVIASLLWGLMVAPFDWKLDALPRDPVPVDAIPDIGENQQIIFTSWPGRSPQDMEDQVTYPLTTALLGVPKVKTVRSFSMFGFSSIYIIFEDDAEFYWSRTRVLEKMNSLPAGMLPDGVKPILGPDATALGQVFWYTLEGLDKQGLPTGGWDLHELRSVQDWYVRYGLLGASGVSEVASVGGFVQEYQIDVDPDAMRANNVTLDMVFKSVKMSNLDVGARTIEINKAEYVIRGLGFIKEISDIEKAVVTSNENIPILVKDVANVTLGPALRRGALDKAGAEAVGGVCVVRYGDNPLAAIQAIKAKIKEITPGLPSKAVIDFTKVKMATVRSFAEENGFEAYGEDNKLNQEAWKLFLTSGEDPPEWLKYSQINIVPFYDRSALINETLGTLETALTEEILITIIVILVMMMHLRSSGIISLTLPFAVILCFIAMKIFHVDANIVALSGIAIAIGTIVDMGVIICENILTNLEEAGESKSLYEVVFDSTSEVGGAVLTAVLTTIVSFLPVFTMEGAEGKLFKPLAYTKSFALLAAVIVALTVTPVLAQILYKAPVKIKNIFLGKAWKFSTVILNLVIAVAVCWVLSQHWLPLGPSAGEFKNFVAVAIPIAGLLSFFILWQQCYRFVLRAVLTFKNFFLMIIIVILMAGYSAWLGFDTTFSWLPNDWKTSELYVNLKHKVPGLQKEFMPPLDEGSYLYMPTTMVHASIGEALDSMSKQDIGFDNIPEVDLVVGKLGRAETPLDPAPISMFESVINYKSEYIVDEDGHRQRFKFEFSKTDLMRDSEGKAIPANDGKDYVVQGKFFRDDLGALIPDEDGMPFPNWRMPLDTDLNEGREIWDGINSPDDIWDEIIKAGEVLGTTSAPKLQPIAARIVMLQSGMRAPMGIKVNGPDLETIENFGVQLEKYLKDVPGVNPAAVIADRIVGKPYLEIEIDRDAIARYGLHISSVQQVIEVAIGGKPLTRTVEGRERYPVRVRYQRELRDSLEEIENILVAASNGQQIPLKQLTTINYVRGPQVIKNEDTFLTGYVLFDKLKGHAEVDVVENAQKYLNELQAKGELVLPDGVKYKFSGSYENQLRAEKKLRVVLPLAMFVIFIILFLHFKNIPNTMMVFSGIAVAWAGGFMLIWLYGQAWFLDGEMWGFNFRDLFNIKTINLSVAVWVGFLALFGIATDDGVVMGTYLKDQFKDKKTDDIESIRNSIILGAQRRIRPCLMTTATTLLALLPVLSSTGRGSDVMIPMAIPSFGGMLIVQLSVFLVPCLFCMIKEFQFYTKLKDSSVDAIFISFLVLGLAGGAYAAATLNTMIDPMFIVIAGVLASLAILCLLISLLVLPMDFVYIKRNLKKWISKMK
ncbi:efflux RND transporter permease subunit [Lentisphaera profundi]|uniref:Efflux RND transporter permease subunit n=1 Tax=Lentisphaera profundi TaxID=1658616 RepID=A0ABY7VQ57_9BACT|nr:efflux RND transporter permease subunit [Lentisphaera profundi]WDE95348.1 efflux RND transporter permease subunit [Lentisphaera profundi]